MRTLTMAGATVLLAVCSTASYAAPQSRGASELPPGDRMNDARAAGRNTTRGASQSSPGHRMQAAKAKGKPVTRGASQFAPGQRIAF
jgi:hypothetical protein